MWVCGFGVWFVGLGFKGLGSHALSIVGGRVSGNCIGVRKCRVSGFGLRFWVLGYRVESLEFGIQGSGLRVWGLGFGDTHYKKPKP